jgi:hypothetical protein
LALLGRVGFILFNDLFNREAMTQEQLFLKATVPSKTTGPKALKLLDAGLTDRAGKGVKEDPFRYFAKR